MYSSRTYTGCGNIISLFQKLIKQDIHISLTFYFFYNIRTSLNFFHTVMNIINSFPRFVPLCVPIYSLIRWGGSFHGKLHKGHTVYCPYRLHKPISGVCHDPHQNMTGILALTRRQIGRTGWPELPLQIAPYWNEALGEMFSQKRHPPDDI